MTLSTSACNKTSTPSSLADSLVRVDGVSGATDLGDGRVVLILDPAALARLTNQRARRVIPDAAAWGRLPA